MAAVIAELNTEERQERSRPILSKFGHKVKSVLSKYMKFVGPGLMVSVAYMDPGNYSTAVDAGARNRFALLFVVLLSNIIAIFLQSLCIKLGTVTGLDLSRACRKYLPRWMNWTLYFFAEAAIIATDVAEVIGSAVALNILIKVPLAAGVAITVVDVLFVMIAYKPGCSSMRFVRFFEFAVAALVMGVCVCFCVELAFIPKIPVGVVMRGFAPSKEMFQGNGIYIATSILGATVMPHSLFLGSGLVQPRLLEYDLQNGYYSAVTTDEAESSPDSDEKNSEEKLDKRYQNYKPTMAAISYALKYSISELAITLFTFALFVNASILIISGATLYGSPEAVDADLYTIHHLLSKTLAPIAGTIFMLALLMSGQSAGIVCTIAGQIVSEGHINWKLKPWKRRVATRLISIIPCLAISLSIGRTALSKALNASQVVLSLLLPFLTAPLIYFTCKKSVMSVRKYGAEDGDISSDLDSENGSGETVDMSNNWVTSIIAVVVWLFISVLNVYAIVQLGLSHGDIS
ncbi:divalent metal ion transporter SMF1 [Lachancea thermotolerans CBS 6340]|uniref:KLTH0F18744p n=1 Tax=Lachancea thermotolerans (strain ATCC 56472 / CBS 6340 / NRRL Y-8284) TaxID=559295 RepID=C5DJS4_LACTC|nr:KLTH0F18744p [Lachancea thermotolerans CBS 6340]CAR24563.1 KLTH0F18744p [Lachancea thermotolerans CBS 6340]